MNQNLYNVDKKTTDKGWKAMRATLDREMPVEQPRRRVWLLWLLALLLPAAGFFFWPKTESAQPVAPASTPERPVAERQVRQPNRNSDNSALALPHVASEERIGAAAAAVRALKTEEPTLRHTRPTTHRANAAATPAANTPIAAASPAKTGAENPAATSLPVAQILQAATPIEVAAETPASVATPYAPDAPNTSSATTTPAAGHHGQSAWPTESGAENKISATPTAELAAQPHNPPPAPGEPAAPTKPVQDKNKIMAWGATAGLLAKPSALLGGTSLGLTADARLGKRWGFRTGLAYQYHRLQGDDRPIVTVTSGAYAEATGDVSILTTNGFIVNAHDLTAPVYVPVSRLHRLEVPLTAFWEATSKLRLYGGPSVGLNVWTQTGSRALKNSITYDVKSGMPAHNLNQKVSTQLREIQAGLTLGAGYRLHQHLEVGLAIYSPIRALSGNKRHLDYSTPVANLDTKESYNLAGLVSTRREAALGRPLLHLSATAFF